MNVLEIKDVHKRLGTRNIIKGISLSVKEGEIFGFLGPNGAGKTTTIRMIVGLIAPNKGSITILGEDVQHDKEKALRAVGAVVENPELYTYLTGKENLRQLARIYNNISNEDIDEVVELVGLTERINDKVKKYSLGMKQRLGLAEALLAKPKLLILDEPTNGLDPNGIIEFRELVKKIAKERNTSVFISSHILSEIEQLCDTVAFIDKGIIKSVESINGNSAKTDFQTAVLSTPELDKSIELLKTLDFVHEATVDVETITLQVKNGLIPQLVIELTKNDIPIEEIYKKKQDLEERYMQLVEGGSK